MIDINRDVRALLDLEGNMARAQHPARNLPVTSGIALESSKLRAWIYQISQVGSSGLCKYI
jgi:hypothetical protein